MVSTTMQLPLQHLAAVTSLALLTLALVWGASGGIHACAGSSGERGLKLPEATYSTLCCLSCRCKQHPDG